MLGLRQMFQATTKATKFGVQGYHLQKKYVDTRPSTAGKSRKQQNNNQLKKGSYLDDYIAIHGKIPGPGVYNYVKKGSQYIKNSKKPTNVAKKKTFIDQIIQNQKREKRPAPGQYKTMDEERMTTSSTKRTLKKKDVPSRTTYLDEVQYEAIQNPGVGNYNPRPQSAHTGKGDRKKPEDWIKQHQKLQKKKKIQEADNRRYDPFSLQKKSNSKRSKSVCGWGNVQRFPKDKSNNLLGPGKYINQDDWFQTKGKNSRAAVKSVYYK